MDVVIMTSSIDFMSLDFSILAVVMLVSYSNMLKKEWWAELSAHASRFVKQATYIGSMGTMHRHLHSKP